MTDQGSYTAKPNDWWQLLMPEEEFICARCRALVIGTPSAYSYERGSKKEIHFCFECLRAMEAEERK